MARAILVYRERATTQSFGLGGDGLATLAIDVPVERYWVKRLDQPRKAASEFTYQSAQAPA